VVLVVVKQVLLPTVVQEVALKALLALLLDLEPRAKEMMVGTLYFPTNVVEVVGAQDQ
jgi:ABC-type transport system involved in cytochrome c biogenesis permease component